MLWIQAHDCCSKVFPCCSCVWGSHCLLIYNFFPLLLSVQALIIFICLKLHSLCNLVAAEFPTSKEFEEFQQIHKSIAQRLRCTTSQQDLLVCRCNFPYQVVEISIKKMNVLCRQIFCTNNIILLCSLCFLKSKAFGFFFWQRPYDGTSLSSRCC